ncbi:protoporphyrinogen oxidase [Okibacterium fritillariae]|uniref:Coproporphyrinogen III oxidase n=1 Tax=Okibacterium fritillariae TaxID=123320 RepID=A0A1T5IGK9_9MICO|nr:protoporphyrinogen oxidase [Okibacterium fritillariae]SKC38321.1 oxygen-dependent protoporphyrinogen oxidase [Okibacterium fritillariae]
MSEGHGPERHVSERHVSELHAVVVGGGVAGLVAAREIAKIGVRVTILEATDAAGGALAQVQVAGLTVDSGAESYATRGGHVAALVHDLGLDDQIVKPNPQGAWLRLPDAAGGELTIPMPKGGVLGIPSNPFADDVRLALGWGGAWRAYLDRVMPVLAIGRVHNLGRLVERRMGRKVLERLVWPVAGGVYSASPYDLEVDLAAPGLNKALTRAGSLSGAIALLRGDAKPGSAVSGLRGGMYRLVEALIDSVATLGGELRTGAPVATIESLPEADTASLAAPRWRTVLADGETLDSDFLVLAAPESVTRTLLAELPGSETLRDALDQVPDGPAPIELVTLVLDAPALDSYPRGTGILVAPGSSVRAKAMTHSDAKWSWLAERAAADGPHRHVIRLSYGRQGDADSTAALGDAELVAQALADASLLFGTPLTAEQVVDAARTPWRGTVPVATIGHRQAAERVREAVEQFEGLEVAGAWLSGTGLASVVPDASAAASRVRHAVVAETSMP